MDEWAGGDGLESGDVYIRYEDLLWEKDKEQGFLCVSFFLCHTYIPGFCPIFRLSYIMPSLPMSAQKQHFDVFSTRFATACVGLKLCPVGLRG